MNTEGDYLARVRERNNAALNYKAVGNSYDTQDIRSLCDEVERLRQERDVGRNLLHEVSRIACAAPEWTAVRNAISAYDYVLNYKTFNCYNLRWDKPNE